VLGIASDETPSSSSVSAAGIAYDPVSHLPKSKSAQRLEQKGRYFASDSFSHMGQGMVFVAFVVLEFMGFEVRFVKLLVSPFRAIGAFYGQRFQGGLMGRAGC
jgi:hypothetical protein